VVPWRGATCENRGLGFEAYQLLGSPGCMVYFMWCFKSVKFSCFHYVALTDLHGQHELHKRQELH
jgi:hypothetical protein